MLIGLLWNNIVPHHYCMVIGEIIECIDLEKGDTEKEKEQEKEDKIYHPYNFYRNIQDGLISKPWLFYALNPSHHPEILTPPPEV